ncbi:MAG TPA: hydroxyacylglutathione hydrolase, partial [Psychrobacter sp.]|nr:hydroxyacylglutathione hydrolase [Psychrobacter sp.]
TQEPSVIAGVKSKVIIDDDKSLTIFAALRELKNNF